MQVRDSKSPRQTSVLVVDDEEDVREIFRLALSRKGYQVTPVGTGAEAIQAAAQNKFQLAFIDIAMPGMDGLETMLALKDVSPHTNVVMITAFFDSTLTPDDRGSRVADCLAQGARACLRKPFGPDTIVRTAQYYAR